MDRIIELAEIVTVTQKKRVIKDYAAEIYVSVSTNHKEQMDSLVVQISGLTRLVATHMS